MGRLCHGKVFPFVFEYYFERTVRNMNLTEKSAYIKGLAEGLNPDSGFTNDFLPG